MLETDIDQNNEQLDDIPRETNNIKKAVRIKKRKGQEHRQISSRAVELKNIKTEPKNNIEDALNQTISHIKEPKDLVKLQNKEIKRKI